MLGNDQTDSLKRTEVILGVREGNLLLSEWGFGGAVSGAFGLCDGVKAREARVKYLSL